MTALRHIFDLAREARIALQGRLEDVSHVRAFRILEEIQTTAAGEILRSAENEKELIP